MSTKGTVLTVVGIVLLAMSVLGLVESVHASAKVVYSVMIPLSAGVIALGIRTKRVSPQ
jgi:hypothetical protein